ncbi:MAG: hypothetical protein IKA72_02300 [Clostridia bacterium]|nr:hypothetical protein [Clostridia bacterium]
MIKNQKNKLLTLLVAGVIGTAALGGAVMNSYTAKAADSTYSLATIFTTSQASLSKDGSGETGEFKMELSNGGKVSYTRDLALKWYEKSENTVQEKYMNMDFTLTGLDFTELVFTFEAASLTATKDEKAVNKVVFTKDGNNVKVSVNDSTTLFDVDATKKLTLSLAALDQDTAEVNDSFAVVLKEEGGNTNTIGAFKNIAVNFAEYDTSKKIYSLAITAKTENDAKAALLLHQINGQSLTVNANNKFVDNTAPVLVVNEDIDGYVLGTAFALDYEVVDVLDRTVTKKLKYYQYDPDDAAAAKKEFDESTATDKVMKAPEYQTLSTTTYFLETNYTYNDSGTDKSTTVYKTSGGTEYVSIMITLTDDGANEDNYMLDWYLAKARTQVDTTKAGFTATEGYTDIDYIQVYANNDEGAKYTFLELDESDKSDLKNKFTENQAYTDFVAALADLERDDDGNLLLSAGESSYLYLPSMKGLFTDNGGYSNLKFTISYKTGSSNTAKTSSGLSASSLKLEVTQAGTYEFKIFAVDKAGNNMKYYLDGELVDVSASNIWSIEQIPSFSFKVANKGLKVEDGGKKKETEVLYETYDLPSFDVIGSADADTEYALFYIDRSKIENTLVSKLYDISYSSIANRAKTLKTTVEERGLDLYMLAYAMEIAGDEASARTLIKDAFLEIDEFNHKIDKDLHPDDWANSDNDYAWMPDSQSFAPQKTGMYLVFAYFTDPDVAAYDAGAYMVVSVDSEADVIKGENEWLKNNMVSIILFSIAGVMAILIIILLVVKPSNETLEDYDEPKTKKQKKSKE